MVFALSNVRVDDFLHDVPRQSFFSLLRLSLTFLWTWTHLLMANLSNQRLPHSIIEDSVNKPWRPLPSGRISPEDARRLRLFVIPAVLLLSYALGVTTASVALVGFLCLYNDRGGAELGILRNFLNACGLLSFGAGATAIAAGVSVDQLTTCAFEWFGIIGLIITTTVHVQDLEDMPGDRARHRHTIPLFYGETVSRWSIAALVSAWSVTCPLFWSLKLLACVPSVALGGYLAARVVLYRSVEADKHAWRMWCLWMILLYLLPLFKESHGGVDRRV
ncbi:MAG: hypothetical protein M1816_003090 [Peltula sp. TS41687]|nr:MAG: hypothetical protein M1816_003090 [Peltula sp. TS41687]